jgi:hypothetical protein
MKREGKGTKREEERRKQKGEGCKRGPEGGRVEGYAKKRTY